MRNIHKIGGNIYITSNEEITSSKDWFFDLQDNRNQLHQVGYDLQDNGWTEQYEPEYFKKVILTTDKVLIADGVQAIDDEFNFSKDGAKWQEEQSYSEQEVIDINIAYMQYLGSNQGGWVNFKEWFNQNKKKVK